MTHSLEPSGSGTEGIESLSRLEKLLTDELSEHVHAYGIYQIDLAGRIRSWNPGAQEITGFTSATILGQPYTQLFGEGERRKRTPEKNLAHVRAYHHLRDEQPRRRADGSSFEARITLDAARNDDGELIGFVEVLLDVTEEKERERALYRRATRDALTGVFNRGHFTETAKSEIERAIRFCEPITLAFIDLDHFKSINDRYGHEAGDQALITVANYLSKQLRRIDVLGRLGGEEFAILLPRSNVDVAYDLLQRVRLGISELVLKAGLETFRVTVSMGLAQLSPLTQDFPALLRAADTALYRAKREGRNQIQVWRGP